MASPVRVNFSLSRWNPKRSVYYAIFSTYSIPFITFAHMFKVELWRSKTND